MRILTRLDAAPTEVQMKLAIAQTLSLPFAYNSPVVVLDFEVDEDGNISGRFKDAGRPRVFSFELDGESVMFRPFVPGRMDSVEEWEEFSDGYSFRVDAGIGTGKKAQCVKPTAYNCGQSCINVLKDCRAIPKDNTSKTRLKKLNNLAKAYYKEYEKAEEGSEEKASLREKGRKANLKMLDLEMARTREKAQEEAKKTASAKKASKPSDQERIADINKKIRTLSEQKKTANDEDAKQIDDEIQKLSAEGSKLANKRRKELQKKSADKMKDVQLDPPKPETKGKTAKSPASKANSFYSDEPIKDYETFKKEIPKELARLDFEYNYDGLVPIHKLREELKGRVNDKDFDKWMMDSQGDNDNIQLITGNPNKPLPGGIDTKYGNKREYVKFTDEKAKEQAKIEIKRKPGQISDLKEFSKLATDVYEELNKNNDYDSLVPIYQIRRAMGDKVSRGDFNNLIMKMQENDEFQLIGGSVEDSSKDKIEDSITRKLGGLRTYAKRIK